MELNGAVQSRAPSKQRFNPSPQQTVTAELADMSKPPSGCFAQSI
jgi:hypothetical protein